jgi:ribosomal protein S18 acetylase RimI-like enzyme
MTAKARKEKLKAETAAINARVQIISSANSNPDNLSDLPMFQQFNKNGIFATNTYYQTLPDDLKDWVYDLTYRNMFTLYDETWGWKEAEKRRELYNSKARYCILRVNSIPVGFVHMRFEIETGQTRTYIFEFQIEPEFQRKGLGKFLLQTVEFITLKRGIESVMLTVFRINTAAMAFYGANHYKLHEMSPGVRDPTNLEYDYEIMYKSLVKK